MFTYVASSMFPYSSTVAVTGDDTLNIDGKNGKRERNVTSGIVPSVPYPLSTNEGFEYMGVTVVVLWEIARTLDGDDTLPEPKSESCCLIQMV